jgi:hypothetical protein
VAGAEKRVSDIEKVKAHQNLEELEDEEWFMAKGNDAADFYANLGTLSHGFSKEVLEGVTKECDQKVKWLCELGRRLSAWPRAHELFGKLEKTEASLTESKEVRRHQIGYDDCHIWRCAVCWYTPRVAGTIPAAAVNAKCPGRVVRFRDLIGDPRGHVLVYGVGCVTDNPLVWCIRCGYYAHSKPRNLMRECMGAPQSTTAHRTLKVTSEGRDPETDEPLCSQGYLRNHQYGAVGAYENLDEV